MADPAGRPIAVWPRSGRFESLEAAVVAGGGILSPLANAEALIWADPEATTLGETVATHPHLQWVSLPYAGVEPHLEVFDTERVWTAAKGVYAEPVAEHALAMALAGLRGLVTYGRRSEWSAPQGTNLLNGSVTIFGGGGITEALIGLLEPFNCSITVVRRKPMPLPGADYTVTMQERLAAIEGADLVVLALALTPETEGFYGREEFAAMQSHAWLVNVARGGHVNSDALLTAAPCIGGAALDVTDPEPLPAQHPLWDVPNIVITPHIGNTPEMALPLLAKQTTENVRRFIAGEDLLGVVDTAAGY